MELLCDGAGGISCRSVRQFWGVHTGKGLESLAPKIKRKNPPRIVSDQIAYKFKYIIKQFFPRNFSLVEYCYFYIAS